MPGKTSIVVSTSAARAFGKLHGVAEERLAVADLDQQQRQALELIEQRRRGEVGGFRRGIDSAAARAQARGLRGDIDDTPTACPLHCRQCEMGRRKDQVAFDADEPAPFLGRRLGEQRMLIDAGVVDENIE